MTQKALNFVVNGMLTTEREITEKRIAHILSQMPTEIVDGFTDGFVVEIEVNHSDLANFMITKYPERQFVEFLTPAVEIRDMRAKVTVRAKVVKWKNPNGSDWDMKYTKDEKYTEKRVETYTEVIEVYPDSRIPGIKQTIL